MTHHDPHLLERRSFLWLPIAAAGGSLLHGAPLRAASLQEAQDVLSSSQVLTPLSRDEFALRWQAMAAEILLLPAEFDEAYFGQLTSLITRLPIETLPRLENPRGSGGLKAGPTWFVQPCLTVEFQMEPGAALRTHNHPPQIVVTLCAGGEASYRHFEIHGDAPPCTQVDGTKFTVRETRSGLLRPGQTTALTRARDGMHGFVAGTSGARLVDFTLSLTEDVETFSYLDVSPQPTDPVRRLYAGAWTGK